VAKQITDGTFSLMFEFGRLIRSRMNAHPSPTLPQLEALHFIAPECRTMNALAAHLKVKAPSASALATELVRAGLITRSASAHDRREVTLALTRKGAAALRISIARRKKIIGEVLTPLSTRDRDAFNRILQTVVTANR
jgi:DNA-binding MarR family transcriptional regulator